MDERADQTGFLDRPDVKAVGVYLFCVTGLTLVGWVLGRILGVLAGTAVGQVVFFGVLPLFLVSVFGLEPHRFRFQFPRKGTRVASLLLPPVAMALFFQYQYFQEEYLYRSFDQLEALYREAFAVGEVHPLFLFGVVAVLPAACEEFLFRGVLLGGLKARIGAPAAVIVSAVLFAVVHPLPGVPAILLLGLVFGAMTAVTRSLLPAAALHFLNNAVVVASLTGTPAVTAPSPLSGFHPALFAGSLVATVGLLVWAGVAGRGSSDSPDAPPAQS